MSKNACTTSYFAACSVFAAGLAIGSTFLRAHDAIGADFPSKPIRLITTGAGGSHDTTSRLIGAGLARDMGQPVVIDNRAGSAVIPGQAVALAAPDGYTLLLYGSTIWLLPLLQANVPFDPLKDFAPVTLAARVPMILVVNSSLPVNSVADLIRLAQAKPGELNYGSAAIGAINHLAPELFKSMAQVNIVHILYKGVSPALNDLISGRLQVMFPAVDSGMPHVKAGRLRGLAVSGSQPTALAPGLPTIASAGLPGYEASLIAAVLAPSRTPPTIVNRLNEAIVRVLGEPQVKERLFAIGVEAVGSSRDELAETAKVEVAKWGKLIKEAGIRSH